MDVEQSAKRARRLEVEVEKPFPATGEKRADVVGIILEKRTFAISRHDGLPMNVPPVAVIADANILHGRVRGRTSSGAFHRDAERKRPVGRGDDAAVAVGLLNEMFASVDEAGAVSVELLIPLQRSEVGRSQHAAADRPLRLLGEGEMGRRTI